MLKDITLGQYFPGNTVIHRLDPRTKLIFMVAYITALFLAKGGYAYTFLFSVLILCLCISRIGPRAVLRGLRPIFIIMILTMVLNIFFIRGETVLVEWRFILITQEGVTTAVFMAWRLVMLIISTFLLTYTTSPIVLTDGLERLLGPLKKLRVPVHEFSMMMSIALRFIPTLIEETDKIMSAQKSRGADFESGGLMRRAKALLPIVIPLFISAFRRADELATAMECRCYHGGEGRTKMNVLKLAGRDYTALICAGAVVAAVVIHTRIFL